MFNKKECSKCGKKSHDKYEFCPYCGEFLGEENEDFGILGKNDFANPIDELKLPIGLNGMFNSLFKSLSKEIEQLNKESMNNLRKQENNGRMPNIMRRGTSISISISGNDSPKIKVESFGNIPKQNKKINEKRVFEIPNKKLPRGNLKRFPELPKEEPETNFKRFSDKIIYEINMPGVDSIDDISLLKLENSIEVKAVSKNKAYSKVIPVSLPIVGYNLDDGKFFVEFGV